MTNNIVDFLDRMQDKTEIFLTNRKLRKIRKKERLKTARGEALDWLNSFLFAVIAVFLVSLYLFQLYVIPSESMVSTLNIADRVGVYKRAYGTELLSFGYKTDKRWATEGDIIVFYNPNYVSKGILRENIENFMFLITFSIYNPSKEGKLYVKRSIGNAGDRLFFRNGDLYVQHLYSENIENESESTRKFTRRTLNEDDEKRSQSYAHMLSYQNNNVWNLMPYTFSDQNVISHSLSELDYFTILQTKAEIDSHILPYSSKILNEKKGLKDGFFINSGYILPLGDNRDNSQDARYFGPVKMNRVIGRAIFRFWPLSKIKKL